MTDHEKLEKVIKGLECCQLDVNKCLDCPYLDTQNKDAECGIELHQDALTLLKAHKTEYIDDWGEEPVSVEATLRTWQEEQEVER